MSHLTSLASDAAGEPARGSSRLADGRPVVCVVDDDASVRESVKLLIQSADWQPELFASAREFLAWPRPCTASCLVLDVLLPDLNGLDLQERLAADRTDMPIIFITGYGDVPMIVRAMKHGATEFLTKPFRHDVLITAIKDALQRSAAALDEADELRALRARYELLSRREREVMSLVLAGLLNKQVAAELGISEITVKAHRGRVMEKMKARRLPALVNMAARLQLTSRRNV
jgi:FixJ family two-component response regulator